MRSRALWFACALAVLCGVDAPRGQSSTPTTFDVVSIKPNKSGLPGFGGLGFQPDRFSATRVTVRALINSAYVRQPFERRQVLGGPGWIDTEYFDVDARTGSALSSVPNVFLGQMRVMLRNLLAERFQLAVHDEQRELPIYALVMARSDGRRGPQLRVSDLDCAALMSKSLNDGGGLPKAEPGKPPPCSVGPNPGHLIASSITMAALANVLSPYVDRAIVDRTGLTQAYDAELSWTPAPGESAPFKGDENNRPPADGPSLFTALQEQLGLKLEPTKGPVDVLVVDHVEHPTEN